MHRIGFDSDQYVEMQSRHIAQRRSEFGGKLYLEFGGKLIDDMAASSMNWQTKNPSGYRDAE